MSSGNGALPAHADERDTQGIAKLELRIWIQLLTCSNLAQALLRRNFHDEFGMTLPAFDILVQINRPPLGPSMGELSDRLMVSKGSVTDLVERLESRELLLRRSDPHDGRVQHVYLTAQGRRLLDRVIPRHDAWIKRAMEGIDRHRLGALHTGLDELKDSLRAVGKASRTARRHRGDSPTSAVGARRKGEPS